MNDIATLDTNNYAAMAKAMGVSTSTNDGESKSSNLARLRIHHSALMGTEEIKGKRVNVEVVPAGTYKLEIPNGPTYYATEVKIRPFVQRYMHKRFIKGVGDTPNKYVKTVMADDLNIDLKDNEGGFNCGKPAGFIKDFKALPEKMQDLLKQIKRVRVVFGVVELVNAVDAEGNDVTVDATPFIWEIDNRDAFKEVGTIFTRLGKMRRLPPQHMFTATTAEQKLPNGNSFFLPAVSLDVMKTLELDGEVQEHLAGFLGWVRNYNEYISNTWDTHVKKKDDVDFADDFIDIDSEEFA